MKQVLIKQGQAVLADVPAPEVEPGTVLVRVARSCISAGTEMSGVRASGEPIWKKALRKPEKVAEAARMVLTQGLARTRSAIEGKMNVAGATGYSAAGTVIAVGAGVADLAVGDRVACAGAQYAHHAEYIRVPRNLVVPAPEGLTFEEACTVTLGAIALQGVRRAQPTLGETFVVVGLGILGQLAAQLLKANGCRVIGTDLDPGRIALARQLGMDAGVTPADGDSIEQVARLSDGIGADGVIITAASPSDAIISQAFRMCRRKGRVVLVGDVGLHLDRSDFYQKELDFFISTSYGPGRYDARYEEHGLDYPVGYVRWTENRNMSEYLRLLAGKTVSVGPLISAAFPAERATEAYESLKAEGKRPLMVLLEYPDRAEPLPSARAVPNPKAIPARAGAVRLAVVGAGGFAKGMHLPNMAAMPELFHLRAVASRTGHNATGTATQFGATYATTRFLDVLEDKDVDAVLIATRHDLHASMALDALRAGKHVLLEKPLALKPEEVEAFRAFYEDGAPGIKPILLTGFNRRFSPSARLMQAQVAGRAAPMILDYRMNAGHLPLDHWVHGAEGGGRNLGEACHIYDLFTYLTGSRVKDVRASAIRPASGHYSHRDNFTATMTFADGSLATLTYTSLGSKDYPKEKLEVFCDGKVLCLEDYRKLEIHGAKAKGLNGTAIEKGQKEELEAFGRAIQKGGEWPIPLWQQIQATEIAFRVETDLSPSPT
ncbi:MAG: bi-domain-containing oxidoreductase [Fibrobacteres bacterium]|nr:bi-domain-containing oxidoreductase [Fibrobacterota bacterium]